MPPRKMYSVYKLIKPNHDFESHILSLSCNLHIMSYNILTYATIVVIPFFMQQKYGTKLEEWEYRVGLMWPRWFLIHIYVDCPQIWNS
jgi:hypothetical protein